MRDNRKQKNHRLANRQTLVFGHTFGELNAHKSAQGRKKGGPQAGLVARGEGTRCEGARGRTAAGLLPVTEATPANTRTESTFSEPSSNLNLIPTRQTLPGSQSEQRSHAERQGSL